MATQVEKGAAFAALHQREGVFILANAWDVGSARVLGVLGFEARATTSAGYAHAIGVPTIALGARR